MSMKRKALGKGLKALIPVAEQPSGSDTLPPRGGLFECPVDRLVPNESQPRQAFDEEKLQELTESVRSHGVLQPLVVRALENGTFQIVAGERRWRAARLASFERVPVVVKDLSDAQSLEVALIENIQREDLNPLEEAEAYRQLLDEHGLTQEQLSKRVGRQRSTVANALRLLKLPDELQKLILNGSLMMGHARALVGLDSATAQLAIARKVVRDGMSVRACEEIVRRQISRPEDGRANRRSKSLNPDERHLIEDLQHRFGTKVDLQPGKKGGKVVIHYYSNQDLDRIVQVLEGR